MRRNARVLARHLNVETSWLEATLRIPPVVVFTGHMVDQPGRSHRRFPPKLEQRVGDAIKARLNEISPGFGFAGAACGSDILFLEAMKKFGETHVVLPFEIEEFRRNSVDIVESGNWSRRFDAVLLAAANVLTASGAPSDWGGIVYEYSNLLLLGLAQLKSKALDTELIGLAVWDGRPGGDGSGGTAWTVSTWKGRQIRFETIDAGRLLRGSP
jgi:hypothetical protein